VFYPAAFSKTGNPLDGRVIAVGASVDGARAKYSNDVCWTDASAPGLAYARFPWRSGTDFAKWAGTSFSTARVTGALAGAADPNATWTTATGTTVAGSDVQRLQPTC
jgi:subtilisin family serine protease